jgi:hypothetical protein
VAGRLDGRPYKRNVAHVTDHAGGRTAAVRFKEFSRKLMPDAEFLVEDCPTLGDADYVAGISKMLATEPGYVWLQIYGADLLTFSKKKGKPLGFRQHINDRFMTVIDANTLRMLGDNAPGEMDVTSLSRSIICPTRATARSSSCATRSAPRAVPRTGSSSSTTARWHEGGPSAVRRPSRRRGARHRR